MQFNTYSKTTKAVLTIISTTSKSELVLESIEMNRNMIPEILASAIGDTVRNIMSRYAEEVNIKRSTVNQYLTRSQNNKFFEDFLLSLSKFLLGEIQAMMDYILPRETRDESSSISISLEKIYSEMAY